MARSTIWFRLSGQGANSVLVKRITNNFGNTSRTRSLSISRNFTTKSTYLSTSNRSSTSLQPTPREWDTAWNSLQSPFTARRSSSSPTAKNFSLSISVLSRVLLIAKISPLTFLVRTIKILPSLANSSK